MFFCYSLVFLRDSLLRLILSAHHVEKPLMRLLFLAMHKQIKSFSK